jgi:hypothetical protein
VGALAKGRVGGGLRRGEERRRPLQTGGKGSGSGWHSGNRGEARVGSEERAPAVAHGWGAAGGDGDGQRPVRRG